MSKFHPGDRVRIRQWDDMKNEFGLTSRGNINCRCIFPAHMKSLCGKEMILGSVSENGCIARITALSAEDQPVVDRHIISEDMLEMAYPDFDFDINDADFQSILGG